MILILNCLRRKSVNDFNKAKKRHLETYLLSKELSGEKIDKYPI